MIKKNLVYKTRSEILEWQLHSILWKRNKGWPWFSLVLSDHGEKNITQEYMKLSAQNISEHQNGRKEASTNHPKVIPIVKTLPFWLSCKEQ